MTASPAAWRLRGQRAHPVRQAAGDRCALFPHKQPQVGRNLLVAAAAGVQLESQVADPRHQFELYKVVNVLRLRAAVNVAGRTLRVLVANRVQCAHNLFQLRCRKDARRGDRPRMGLAGSYFLGKQLPVKCQ